MTTVAPRSPSPSAPFWRDARFVRIVAQAVLLAAAVGVVAYLLGNMRTNLRDVGLPTGYGYLDQPYGSDIPFSSFRPSQSVWDALKVGYANTLRIAAAGIVISLILGVIIGVARL